MVQRYDHGVGEILGRSVATFWEDNDGEWVKYTDHEAAMRQAQDRIKQLENAIGVSQDSDTGYFVCAPPNTGYVSSSPNDPLVAIDRVLRCIGHHIEFADKQREQILAELRQAREDIRMLRLRLSDMVTVALEDDWATASTGRQLVLRSAKAILASTQQYEEAK